MFFLWVPGLSLLTRPLIYNTFSLMSGKAKKIVSLAVLLAAAGLVYYYVSTYKRDNGPAPVRTTGVVEALETNISPKIPGKLKTVNFREGEAVKAGDLVATLEDQDFVASLNQAKASLKAAEAALRTGYDTASKARADVAVSRAQVKTTEASLASAEAQYAQAQKDLARSDELFAKGIIAKSDNDLAHTAMNTRSAELQGAKSNKLLSESQVNSAVAGLTQAESNIPTLKAVVAQAKDQVSFQEAKLADTKIYSPVDAVVEYRSLEPAEAVAPGTSILTLIDLAHLWVRIDLEQRYVTQVRPGQRADLTLENVPGRVFEGEVFDVGREGEFAVERDVTRGRQDIKTFRTRIRVKDTQGILKPGMTVIVTIPLQ